MKKCMTCGYDNHNSNIVCKVCNEALTEGHIQSSNAESKGSSNGGTVQCVSCTYHFSPHIIYDNCPACGHNPNVELKMDEYFPDKVEKENTNIKIIMDSKLLGEIRIVDDQLIFRSSKDYPFKRILTISEKNDNGTEQVVKNQKTYGKRKIEETFLIKKENLIELSSKEDNMIIQIDFN